jgi:hypothetical protein
LACLVDFCSENDKIYFPENSTDSDSVNDEECEECYDKLEELLDTRKSRSKKGVGTSMWNICNNNFSTRLFIGNFQ